MTDLLEQRLTEAGHRWRSSQPPPPVVPVDSLSGMPARRGARWGWPAAAASVAAMAVLGGSALLVNRSGDGGPSPVPGGPATHTVGREPARVVPWAPLRATHPHLRTWPHGNHSRPWSTPYDHVSVSGRIAGRVHPGDTLAFTAYLESSTDLPLDPCPDVNVAIGTHFFHTWQLNCAAVPYVDPQGTPYLPASTTVPFRIEATVPDEPGRQKVLFTLDGPHQLPGFYGLVDIGPR